MKMARLSDLKKKEVINEPDGRRLGFLYDVDINPEDGRLEGIILKGTMKMLGFTGKNEDFIIPWDMIKRIGEDIIIVYIEEKYLKKYP